MTTEEKVLKIIKKFKGEAPLSQIAKESKISSGYIDLILKGLERKGKIKFSGQRAWLEELGKRELINIVKKKKKAPQIEKPQRKVKRRKRQDLKKKVKKRRKTKPPKKEFIPRAGPKPKGLSQGSKNSTWLTRILDQFFS